MTDPVRYGLISTAAIGFKAHLPAAKLSENSEIVAVSSRSIDSARKAATEHGLPLAFGSYQEMIDSDEIDAVINTLPNSMHHEWTIKAARAGKHVLCEKPLAASMAEAREMASVSKACGIVLVEGFTPRWNKQLRTIRELIASGEIGDVLRIETCLTFTREDTNDIRFSRELAGGSMMDAGGYAVYAVRFVMGAEPVTAFGFDRKQGTHEVDTTFNGLFQFANGAVASVWSSLEGPRQLPFAAHGTNGKILLEQTFDEATPVIVERDNDRKVIELQSENRFKVQLDEFSDCVSTGKPPEFPVEDGIRNMAAIMALYGSARTGRAVDVRSM